MSTTFKISPSTVNFTLLQPKSSATAYPLENGLVKVVFDEPQRAITRGQAVVLYDGDVVVGGGTIL